MIPLKEGLYSIVNINPDLNDTIEQSNYKNLLNKELQFCISNKEKIIREIWFPGKMYPVLYILQRVPDPVLQMDRSIKANI